MSGHDGFFRSIAVQIQKPQTVRSRAGGDVMRVSEGAVKHRRRWRVQRCGFQAVIVVTILHHERRFGGDGEKGVAVRRQSVARSVLHSGGEPQAVQTRLQRLVHDREVGRRGKPVIRVAQGVGMVVRRVEHAVSASVGEDHVGRVLQRGGQHSFREVHPHSRKHRVERGGRPAVGRKAVASRMAALV